MKRHFVKARVRFILSLIALLSAFALILLRWSVPDFPVRFMHCLGASPGLVLERYNNETWSGDPVRTQTVTAIDFTRRTSDLFQGDHYSIRLHGWLYVPYDRIYSFELLSDDGSDVHLDDELLIADPGLHPMRTILKSKTISKGWHRLQIQLFNRDADSGLRLSWRYPNKPMRVLDGEFLFCSKTSPSNIILYRFISRLTRPDIIALPVVISILLLVSIRFGSNRRFIRLIRRFIGNQIPAIISGGCLFLMFLAVYHGPSYNPVKHGFLTDVVHSPDKAFMQKELTGTTGRFHSHTHKAMQCAPSTLKLTGWLFAPDTGEYGFSLEANDWAILSIDGAEFLVSSEIINYRTLISRSIELQKGLHFISIDCQNKHPPGFLDLKWVPPGSKRYRPIPSRTIFQVYPSDDDLNRDWIYRSRITMVVSGLATLILILSILHLRRKTRSHGACFPLTTLATFSLLFLNHLSYLHYDHQAGFHWLIEQPPALRQLITLAIFLLLSGWLVPLVKRWRRFLKHHRFIEYINGLTVILLLSIGQYLFISADKSSQYLLPGLLFLSAALLLLSTRSTPPAIRKPAVTRIRHPRLKYIFNGLFCIIIVWAVWVRFYRLHEMPPGLWWDEAQTGRVVRSIMSGDFPSIYDLRINAGTIASYLNTGWCYLVNTTSPWGLRSYTAAIGVITVLVSWWFFRQLFSPWWSLFGMALIASSRWLFTINRTAMATIDETILLTFLILMAYIRAQRRNRISDHVITGLLLGTAMHLHTGARILPLIIGADLLIRLLRSHHRLFRIRARNAALLIACAMVTFAPMGMYIADHFNDYMKRSKETLLSTEYPGWYPVQPYLDNVRYYLEMYVVRGDWHPRHNYNRTPQLAAAASVLAVLGLSLSIRRSMRHPVHRLLILGFCLISAQGIMTVHMDGPNLNRVAENIPIVFAWVVLGSMLIARGITAATGIFMNNPARSGALITAVTMVIVGLETVRSEYRIYFEKYLTWPALAQVYGFQPDVVEMARLSKKYIESDSTVEVWSMYAGGDPFQYIYPGSDRLHAMSTDHPPPPASGKPMVFLFPAMESGMREILTRRFPRAIQSQINYQLNDTVPLVRIMKVDFPGAAQ
ncbi:glycosyltransferase family 39 protein [bacterium]|nr:glycosyltransferase family 39 protein [candidate division CSSED10-310 bacterium]